jgi:hypothetical protein
MNVIVTTTINPPTEALRRFSEMKGWQLVVVVDRKTPSDFAIPGAIVLTCDQQQSLAPQLSDSIGWNCIQRRNIGFVYAVKELKADIVATVDDDNIPLPGWGENLMLGKAVSTFVWDCKAPMFDPIYAAGYRHLWHRGFPLQFLRERSAWRPDTEPWSADIQADFWNGDPDIDAICRMEHAPDCTFDPKLFPIASRKPSPFNSQNTFLKASVIPHYFMFPFVGRMDDIWASFYVQSRGFKVIYGKASVTQVRSGHDLTKDMKAEYMGYEMNDKMAKSITEYPSTLLSYFPPKSLDAFYRYQECFE